MGLPRRLPCLRPRSPRRLAGVVLPPARRPGRGRGRRRPRWRPVARSRPRPGRAGTGSAAARRRALARPPARPRGSPGPWAAAPPRGAGAARAARADPVALAVLPAELVNAGDGGSAGGGGVRPLTVVEAHER